MSIKHFDLDGNAFIPYVEFGDPNGAPLVIVPGLGDGLEPLEGEGAMKILRLAYRPLSRFRVIISSRRMLTPVGFTIADMADDVARLMRGLGAAPAAVMGESMGGMIGQELAARHPEIVERLVLASTVAHVDAPMLVMLDRWEGYVRQGKLREHARAARADVLTGRLARLYRVLGGLLMLFPRPRYPERYFIHCAAIRGFDARPLLSRITCPTLVTGGTLDVVTRPELVRELAAGIPNARLVMIDRVGHAPALQRPTVFNRALLGFLAEKQC